MNLLKAARKRESESLELDTGTFHFHHIPAPKLPIDFSKLFFPFHELNSFLPLFPPPPYFSLHPEELRAETTEIRGWNSSRNMQKITFPP